MSNSNDPQALGEFGLIETYFRPLTLGRAEALRLLDDAGILTVAKGEQLVVTTDALVAGRHFLADGPAEDLGQKVLGVNLSDLAAMGAKPLAYTLALAAPKSITGVWLESFTDGLAAAQALHHSVTSSATTKGASAAQSSNLPDAVRALRHPRPPPRSLSSS
mgnify:CR=1 FL=1